MRTWATSASGRSRSPGPALVLPALALNYMGQGALLMRDPAALENPFFRLFPAALLIPAVVLATVATIIASQAVITGAYSLTQQAIQLGLLPRMQMLHTSEKEMGQIYLPLVNWLLLAAVVLAVLGFGSSSALASAYGIAVTVTMLATTILTFFVVRQAWNYPLPVAAGATVLFLVVDACPGGRLLAQVPAGRLVPAGAWAGAVHRHGQLAARPRAAGGQHHPGRSGAAAFPAGARARRDAARAVARRSMQWPSQDTVPQALLHNLKHNQVLHERNVILTVVFQDVPWVPPAERVSRSGRWPPASGVSR